MAMNDIILHPTKEDVADKSKDWVCLVNPELHRILRLLREVDESHYHELIKFMEDLKARF